MSTRSSIIYVESTGKAKSVYCHWDGYPDNNGYILFHHYATEERVKALISLGAISSLGERLAPDKGEEHTFDKRVKDVTTAYHRDRKEKLDITESSSLDRAIKRLNILDARWVYVWRDGKWFYSHVDLDKDKTIKVDLKPLAEYFKLKK